MTHSRNHRAITLVTHAALCLCCAAIWADEPSPSRASSSPAFDTFQVILDRNIFDPSRRPTLSTENLDAYESEKPDAYEETLRSTDPFSPGADYLVVTGALLYDAEAVAFLRVSSPEYATVVRQGDTIAGFQVKSIATNQIVLQNDERAITVPVGFGISRTGSDPWRVAALSDAALTRPPDELDAGESYERKDLRDGPSATPDSAEEKTDGPSNDLLERLRQRRQQELDQ